MRELRPFRPDTGLQYDEKASAALFKSFGFSILVSLIDKLEIEIGVTNYAGMNFTNLNSNIVLSFISILALGYLLSALWGLRLMLVFGTYDFDYASSYVLFSALRKKLGNKVKPINLKRASRLILYTINTATIIMALGLGYIYVGALKLCFSYALPLLGEIWN